VAISLSLASISAYGQDEHFFREDEHGNKYSTFFDEHGKPHYVPERGFVPDEKTAIRIAEAVWLPIYGKHIYNERPFRARLVGDIWHVTGYLPPNLLGGVAEVEISKADGKILRVSHGR